MKNTAASIKSKLLKLSRDESIGFQLLIIRYFQERLLYRMSISVYKNSFFLKGGVLLYLFDGMLARPTKDMDFMVVDLENDPMAMKVVFKEIIEHNDTQDGIIFDPHSISAAAIIESGRYRGVRLFISGKLDSIVQKIQIDIGFGDKIFPEALFISYPVIFDFLDTPILHTYTKESVVAEKFHAMIELSSFNSRMKDFFDVYKLISSETMDAETLRMAIFQTFKHRNTTFVDDHILFTEQFATDRFRNQQWRAYISKIKGDSNLSFFDVLKTINAVLFDIWQDLKAHDE